MQSMWFIAILFMFFNSIGARAYETDQFSYVMISMQDGQGELDKIINQGIEQTARNWNEKRDDNKFAMRIVRLFSSRQLERWVNSSGKIEIANDKANSIFRSTGLLQSIIIRTKGLASTLNLCGVKIGADKMSHFFGVGGIYYYLYNKHLAKHGPVDSELHAIKHGLFTEKTYWGELTTNVFSNADLVANYEGYRFLRDLNENSGDTKSIIHWDGDKPTVARKFNFCNYVNDYWSEALNPSYYQKPLARRVKGILRSYCEEPAIASHLELFRSSQDALLKQRYSHLKLKTKAEQFRLDRVCNEFSKWPKNKREKYLAKVRRQEEKLALKIKDSEGQNNDSGLEMADWQNSTARFCRDNVRDARAEFLQMQEFIQAEWGTMLSQIESSSVAALPVILSQIKQQFQSVAIDSRNNRICLLASVPLNEDARKKVSIEMHACFENHQDKLLLSDHYYFFRKGRMERTSLEGLHGINNEKAYVFRTIPMLCRWY